MTAASQFTSCAERWGPNPSVASTSFHRKRLEYLGATVQADSDNGPFRVRMWGMPFILSDAAALGRFNWARPISPQEKAKLDAVDRDRAACVAAGERVLREMRAERAAAERAVAKGSAR